MKHLIRFIVVVLLSAFAVSAQDAPRALKVGDHLPAIQIPNVINDTKRSFNTSEFKDRLLILDFWSTTCSGCIAALPKMLSLQQQFGDQIKILPVTTEPEALIRSFMKTNKTVKALTVPSVVDDKVLSKWFKHIGQPHEAWIYKGKVIAITGGEYVDKTNIRKVLDGQTLYLPVKDDFYKYDYNRPFLTGNTGAPLAYTAVTGYQEGALPRFRAKTVKDTVTGLYRTSFTNLKVLAAYNMLWDKLKKIAYIRSSNMVDAGGINPNQVILEVNDRDRYIYRSGTDYEESWSRKNAISYEWISKDTAINEQVKSEMIINDLDRLLGLKGRWEKRQVSCLVLIRTDTVDRIKFLSGERAFEYKGETKILRNSDLSSLVYYLNSFHENPPVFDATGYKNPVDITLKFNLWTDIPAIRKALQAYGLDLKEETRELDMFVLTETHFKK